MEMEKCRKDETDNPARRTDGWKRKCGYTNEQGEGEAMGWTRNAGEPMSHEKNGR